MMRLLVITLLLPLLALPARAGVLDVDYMRPSSTKALLYSAFFPGGGYFYMAEQSHKPKNHYAARGVLYLGITAAAVAFTLSQTQKDPAGGALMGGFMIVSVRLLEFSSVTTDAEQDWHANFKARMNQYKSEEAQQTLEAK